MGLGHVIAVTGLRREARILADPAVRTIAGGGDATRLEADIEAACAGASGIISIGLGGALAEGLWPGDWVVASAVVAMADPSDLPPLGEVRPGGKGAEAHAPVDASPQRGEINDPWARRLLESLPGARLGPIAGSDVMLVDAAAKAALHAATGALAVDMESHIVARVAARHGLPFVAARTISDGAGRALPRAAQAGMKPDGGMDLAGVIAALARRPWELPALIRTGVEAEAAFRALLRGRQLLGPALGRAGADLG